MDKIRVLQVVPIMRSAGIENFIMNIYRNIDTEKIQFDFLVHSQYPQEFDNEILKKGGKIFRLTYKDDKNLFKYINDLNNFFKTHKEYKIIHGNMQSMMPLYLLIAKINNIPIRIAHAHNSSYEKTMKGMILHIFSRFSKCFATNLWACSDKAGKYLFGNNKFEIIHNAIDIKKFSYNENVRKKIRNQKNINNEFVIGHIGRFDLQKNHDFLIDIFYEIQKQKNNSILLCLGSGKLKEKIERKVKKLGIEDKVLFEGVVNNSNDYYQAMDCFVFPSLYEGLPLVGVESQISGLCCFFSDSISKELILTDNVHFLSLKSSAKFWADYIINNCSQKRKTNYICDYDLTVETNNLEKKYYNYINESDNKQI